jgi:transposase
LTTFYCRRQYSKEKNENEQVTKRIAGVVLRKIETAQKKKEKEAEAERVEYYIGIDLGDQKSNYCVLGKGGEILVEGSMATTAAGIEGHFKGLGRSRIAIEVGTHSPWVSEQLEEHGHEVYVANARKMDRGKKNRRKNDRLDAEMLARQVRTDPKQLYPIRHRKEKTRQGLVLLRVREALVNARTKLVNAVRGIVKSSGQRLPKCGTEVFHNVSVEGLPEDLSSALKPVLEQIGELTEKIKGYDKEVKRISVKEYPETEILRQVPGVGMLVALAYVLIMEDPEYFQKSRDAGPYLWLVPKQYDSGKSSPQLRITKTGDRMMRRLLVQSAQYILGPFGEDSDLRRHGMRISERGGKNGKKRAIVAVARKLAVLLHRLWQTGEVYNPLYNSQANEKKELRKTA